MHPIRHVDKKRDGRGVEGTRRTTARPIDESPVAAASPPPAGSRGRGQTDPATLHGGGQAAHPDIGRCLYRDGQPGGSASRRRPLRLEPDDVASPTHGGVLSAVTPQKRGRKKSGRHPRRAEHETLRKENARLSTRLKQAELIIDVQKKVSQILGLPLETPVDSGRT